MPYPAFFKFIVALATIIILTVSQANYLQAQLFYSANDTIWVMTSDNNTPVSFAEGDAYDMVADPEGGFLYWSVDAAFDSEIKRAPLDDGSKAEVINDETSSARGMAIDPDNEKLYWVDLANDGEIVRADLDGGNMETLVAGEEDGVTDGALDVALDPDNNHMYWVKLGAVMRAELDGSNVETVITITSYVQPTSIAVDANEGNIYWTDPSQDNIMKAGIDAGDPDTFINADQPAGLAVDGETGKIYWMDSFLLSGGGGLLSRANTDGSEIELITETSFTRGAFDVHGWEGSVSTSTEDRDDVSNVPGAIRLEQNYPNPFNPTTRIQYSLTEEAEVAIAVYDMLGQKVKTLIDQRQSAGTHTVELRASDMTSGIYFYRLTTGRQSITRKMTLLK